MLYHRKTSRPQQQHNEGSCVDRSTEQAECFIVYYFDSPVVRVELFYLDAPRVNEPDFVVTLLDEGEAPPAHRIPRHVDYSWIADAQVPQPMWRSNGEDPSQAEELLLVWIEDCFRWKCTSHFEALVGTLSERIAFEFATFLCGIGETSSRPPRSTPQNSVMLRLVPARVGSLGPAQIRLSIPLLLGGTGELPGGDANDMRDRLRAFLELYDKALGGLLLAAGRSEADKAIQRLHLSYYLALEISSSGVMSVVGEKLLLHLTGDAEGVDLREAAHASVNLVDGIPRYLTAIQRTSTTQLIDFIPELEEVLRSSVFVEPLHFADLVNILANYFGLPTELNLLACRRDVSKDGSLTLNKLSRFAVFTLATSDAVCCAASLCIQYEGRDALPLVTLTSAQQTLCTTDRPIRAKVQLQHGALVMHQGSSTFDATAMSDAIVESVTERLQLFVRACAASSYPASSENER